jgi:predicted alpha-1,2-mannosidase
MKKTVLLFTAMAFALSCTSQAPKPTDYVNPLLGTATLWDSTELGYRPTRRAWGAEAYPGASLPNAMVQVSPVTQFGSGAGYQYEDTIIYAFSHTNMGHWNLNHVPIIAFTGEVTPEDYATPYSHSREEAAPGYYSVFLERGGIEAEVTSTLRCAFHRYTFEKGAEKHLLADLQKANDGIREWDIQKVGDRAFAGFQQGGDRVHFYATTNHDITKIKRIKGEGDRMLSIIDFTEGGSELELRIGFSFVSIENARANLEAEMAGKSFAQVRRQATDTWNALLSKVRVEGGSERQKGLFYSTLYRAFLCPMLRSDMNGDFPSSRMTTPVNGGRPRWEATTGNSSRSYYTTPPLWDTYRNQLILLGLLSPDVAGDVIASMTLRGQQSGFMPSYFHGDHSSAFIAGTYLRGITDGYDVEEAYKLLIRNATVDGTRRGGRAYLDEYIDKGWISEEYMEKPFVIHDERKAAVTKTQEYSYDDYATAMLARALGHTADYEMLMPRTTNYKNLFNPANGFMQGRYEDGNWVEPFDPYFPYYAYMYREANAWQSIFYAPHDPEGVIALYPSPEAAEAKLDSLFTLPWRGYEAHNITTFIGQYSHGNQPDHGFPYMYYYVGKQAKSQHIINYILENLYGMGPEGLAYCGMDDGGEMSAWYVFNALGLYTFSPADPEYLVTVPIFDKLEFDLPEATFTILKEGSGEHIRSITYGGKPITDYHISHAALKEGHQLVITAD